MPIDLKTGMTGKFIRNKGLCQDTVLMEYLKELNFEEDVSSQADIVEERVTTVLSLVQNSGTKISSLISALKFVSLPWKPQIASMVEDCLRLDHPLVETLQRNIAKVKLRF